MNNLNDMYSVSSGSVPANRPLLVFYGDDFTGSTDAMEALSGNGVRTVLFLSPPDTELLRSRFPDIRCFGVAGVSRSMAPEEMEQELKPQLESLRTYGAAVVHYKICSTFDSSPRAGSIGKVLELGRALYAGSRYIPIVAGVPVLKRYTVFGNHFAAVGLTTYRLDRHPTMSRHPITSMHEADLRMHLRQQTDLAVGLLDVLALDGHYDDVRSRLEQCVTDGHEAILFDVLDDRRLETAGALIWDEAAEGRDGSPLFTVGSSGVEYALTAHWKSEGMLAAEGPAWETPGPVDRLLAVSGSCSPVTEAQIEWALAHGFEGIKVPLHEWFDTEHAERSKSELLANAAELLAEGKSVILYSAVGPEDPAIAEIRSRLLQCGMDAADSGKWIGEQLGKLTKEIVIRTELTRVLIAGGDTSGYVTRQLGIFALECIASIVPGGPLCRCYSDDPRLDGLQVTLKGGQVGGVDFFGRVAAGSAQ